MNTSRPSKRQRKENPASWLENESLSFVASPLGGTIRTNVAFKHDKELFLDRLEKEIIPYCLLEDKKAPKELTASKPIAGTTVVKKRLIMGTNQCTRRLEKLLSDPKDLSVAVLPSLIVLARDIYPPTILSHIPVMAQQIRTRTHETKGERTHSSVPILLLPGQASQELGRLFGTKRVSVMMFLPSTGSDQSDETRHLDDKITSFVQFVKKTLQLQP